MIYSEIYYSSRCSAVNPPPLAQTPSSKRRASNYVLEHCTVFQNILMKCPHMHFPNSSCFVPELTCAFQHDGLVNRYIKISTGQPKIH